MKNTREFDRRKMDIAIDIQLGLEILENTIEEMIMDPYSKDGTDRADKDLIVLNVVNKLGKDWEIIDNKVQSPRGNAYLFDEFIMKMLSSAKKVIDGNEQNIELL